MALVVPTVLAVDPAEYETMVARAEGLSRRIHVDICDGIFAENTTVTLAQVYVSDQIELDLHLMLKNPIAQLENAISLKPSLIIFHAESSGDIGATMAECRRLGIKAGVALQPQTAVASAQKLIEGSDHVLIFTGTLGYNGGVFRPDQLTKVREVRSIVPRVEVSVDGGVSDLNAALIVAQGVDVLYAGSFLHQAEDPQAAYTALTQQIEVKA